MPVLHVREIVPHTRTIVCPLSIARGDEGGSPLTACGIRIGPKGRAMGLIIPTWELDWRHIEAVEEATNGISILREGNSIKFLVLASRAKRQGILAQIETARAAGDECGANEGPSACWWR